MARSIPILVFIAIVSPLLSLGAEVLRVGKDSQSIAITHDETRKWTARDRVCVLQRAREIVCGTVTKVASKGAIVKMDQPNYDVLAGDKVISKFQPSGVTAAPVARSSAPLMNSVPDSGESEIHRVNIAAGVSVGTSFFYPSLNVQFAVAPTIAVGLGGLFFAYSNDLNSLTAFGGMGNLNYYSQEYFRGLWIQVAGGALMLSASGSGISESATSFLGLATVGWRGYWDLGFNIGVGAGLQYISDPGFLNIVTTSSGFKPLIVLDVGISF
jgi:hypothetical protein